MGTALIYYVGRTTNWKMRQSRVAMDIGIIYETVEEVHYRLINITNWAQLFKN